MEMDKIVQYRVYYKDNEFKSGFWYTEPVETLELAEELEQSLKGRVLESHIRKETITQELVNHKS